MHKLAHTLTLTAAAAAIAGCGISNPYQHNAGTTTSTSTSTPTSTASSPAANPAQNPGEPPAPPPPAPAGQAPASVRSTPAGAITQFVTLYMNWTWRTLAAHERKLSQLGVGPARLAEQQAAAAAISDSTIAQSRVYNSGQIISIARSLTNPKQWVIVTREQTGGNSQYDGLQASYHVTLAELAQPKDGGWTVSEWLPQV
ncbi:MAG: hypothetical protein M3Y09_15615 [Actinomycetota bacterium]|nr:hypothetical protein [Actinomycetota bacterium]